MVVKYLAKALSLSSILLLLCNANASSQVSSDDLYSLGKFAFAFESFSINLELMADQQMLGSQEILIQSASMASTNVLSNLNLQADTTSICVARSYLKRLPERTISIHVQVTHELTNIFTPRKCQQGLTSLYEFDIQIDQIRLLWTAIRQVLKNELPAVLNAEVTFVKQHSRQLIDCGDFQYDSNGVCEPCIEGCIKCNNGLTCINCFIGDEDFYGYYKKQDNTCGKCLFTCLTCATAITCNDCIKGNYLNNRNTCQACPANSLTCTSTEVTTCIDGFMPVLNTCVACIANCQECSTPGQCDICAPGFNPSGDKLSCNRCMPNCDDCHTSSSGCDVCTVGYTFVQGTCSKCPLGCSSCSNTGACLGCTDGYFQQGDRCNTCGNNCNSCTSTECTTCLEGYFHNPDDSKDCKPCSNGCASCIDYNRCLYCESGYLNNGLCTACSQGCADCFSDGCQLCEVGKFLSSADKKCYNCMGGCDSCSTSTNCNNCSPGFIWDNANNICTTCTEGCLNCNSDLSCISCDKGYFNDLGHCMNCKPDCSVCTNGNDCSFCGSGTFLDGNNCRKCFDGCADCNDANTCNACMDGYYDDGLNHCNRCQTNCDLCLDFDTCDKPSSGFYFDGARSKPCSFGCTQCNDANTCYTCGSGTYLDMTTLKCKTCAYGCDKCDSSQCFDCKSGFNLVNGMCQPCRPNCEYCLNIDTCDKCFAGYYRQTDNSCGPCVENCVDCMDKNGCHTCKTGYFVDPIGQCTKCQTGCDKCRDNKSCKTCTNSYYLTQNQMCNPCPTGCASCLNPDHCDTCADGFSKNPEGKCLKCSQSCKSCGPQGCQVCNNGFYRMEDPNNAGQFICGQCQTGCLSCTDSQCLDCGPGKNVLGTSCSTCPSGCSSCDQNTCKTCFDGFYFNNNQCTACSVNCEICTSTVCNKCSKGFLPGTNGQCTKCKANCKTCTADLKCTECESGFYIGTDGTCQRCTKFCNVCDSTNCLSCEAGRSYNPTTKLCELCSDRCEQCDSLAHCSRCQSGFYLDVVDDTHASCRACNFLYCNQCSSSECLGCQDGFYLDSGVCKRCIPGCSVCTDGTTCDTCPSGMFSNDDGKCQKCDYQCASCYTDGPAITCDACFPNSYLDTDGKCKQCSANCNDCKTPNKCYACNAGYFVNDRSKCQQCVPHCQQCSNPYSCDACEIGSYFSSIEHACVKCTDRKCNTCPANSCTDCSESYFFNSASKCVHCSPNCLSCDNINLCYNCESGYFIEPTDGQCKDCSEKILNCDLCDNASTCKTCIEGYSVTPSGSCAQCPQNCHSCLSTGCMVCQPGYFLDGANCTPCPGSGCINCIDQNTCLLCAPHNYLTSGAPPIQCAACTDPSCLECTDAATCIDCAEGFYVLNGVCTHCNIESCLACYAWDSIEHPLRCSKCEVGNYIDQNTFECVQCGFDNCAKCDDSTRCDDCLVGYSANIFDRCVECPKNCDFCDTLGRCDVCSHGFFRGLNNQCFACTRFCDQCQGFEFCDKCIDPFYLDNSGTCQPCDDNCDSCKAPSECTDCAENFFLNPQGTCSACSDGCTQCLSATTCSHCSDGYYMENSKCKVCTEPGCMTCSPTTCSRCFTGNYLNPTSKECIPCIDKCDTCTSTTNCQVCEDGTFKVPGTDLNNFIDQCQVCKDNCKTCSTFSTCKSCYEGSNLVDDNCLQCSPHCQECSDASTCTKCMNGFYVAENGACAKCQENCLECDQVDICKVCTNGTYANSDGACVACSDGCFNCKDDTKCINCYDGYYKNSNKLCSACSQGCDKCKIFSVCDVCHPGNFLVENSCLTCKNSTILDVSFSRDFLSINVLFEDAPDVPALECEKIFRTMPNPDGSQSDANPGNYSCNVEQNVFNIRFGDGFSFNDKSLFEIDKSKLFIFTCDSQKEENLMARFTAAPIKPKGIVVGIPSISLGCSASDLEFRLDKAGGNLGQPLQAFWSSISTPENPNLDAFIAGEHNPRISISLGLFNQDTELTVSLTVCNVIKFCVTSQYQTSIFAKPQITIVIDAGKTVTVDPSNKLNFITRILDSCKATDPFVYQWELISTTDLNIDVTSVLTTLPLNTLNIPANFLVPNNVYTFGVTVTSGSLSGSAVIEINAQPPSLVVVLNKEHGSIGALTDFTIDGSQSFDPTQLSNTLYYLWDCYNRDQKRTVCASPDGKSLIQIYDQPSLQIPAANLVELTGIEIVLTITDDIDSRSTSQSVFFDVIQGLSTNIEILFDTNIYEPSYALSVDSVITSTLNYMIHWAQTAGPSYQISPNNLPSIFIGPNILERGENYEFEMHVTEINADGSSGAVAYAFLDIYTNLLPECLSDLTISPSTGVAMETVFTISIDSCNDLDGTESLTYIFGEIDADGVYHQWSTPNSFNSMTMKLPKGIMNVVVYVCDNIFGCRDYYAELTVASPPQRERQLETSTIIDSYESDTTDIEMIPVYAIAYLKTYVLTFDELSYIYDSVLEYVSYHTIDEDTVSIMISVVLEMFNTLQTPVLTYDFIGEVLDMTYEIMNNSTDRLTSNHVKYAYLISQKVIIAGNYDNTYAELANNFIQNVLLLYSVGILPGSVIYESQSGTYSIYKIRDVASSYENTTFVFDDTTTVTIDNLPFNPETIVNLLISIYPQSDEYTNIVDVTFSSSGSYSNNVLLTTSEIVTPLTTPTVYIKFPLLKNSSSLVCQYFDNGWVESDCEITDEQTDYIEVLISHTSMFRLSESTSTSEEGGKAYGPVYVAGIILIILVAGYIILHFIDKRELTLQKQGPIPDAVSDLDKVEEFNSSVITRKENDKSQVSIEAGVIGRKVSIVHSHLLFGIFKFDPIFTRADRFLSICLIFIAQLAIEGALIGYEVSDMGYVRKYASIAIIAVVLTLPVHILAVVGFGKCAGAIRIVFSVLCFVAFLVGVALVVAISAELTVGRHAQWIITFFWGLLFELSLETIIMIPRHLIAKN